MSTCSPLVFGAAAVFASAGAASAQWVTFNDETVARLVLKTVSMNDPEEKDFATADFDKDGWVDLIVVRKKPFSTVGPRQDVLLMNEAGVLVDRTNEYAASMVTKHTDARDVQIVDIDGDGWLDFVIASTFEDPPRVFINLARDAEGTWRGFEDQTASRFPTIVGSGLIRFCSVAVGDITGNGAPDLMFSNYLGGTDVVFVNDGTGVFTDETDARLGSLKIVPFATGGELRDMDLDGDLDFVESQNGQGRIIWNNGLGFFTSKPAQTISVGPIYMFATGDLNNDGRWDIYSVEDDQDTILLNLSAPKDGPVTFQTFSPSPSPRTAGWGGNIKMADVDFDGDIDVGVGPIDVDVGNCGNEKFALLRNDGTGKLADPWATNQSQPFHNDAHDFEFFDLDNDGCLDLVMGLCVGWKVFMQTGNADCLSTSCYADCNGDGSVNIFDFLCFQGLVTNADPAADCNGDGSVNIFDFLCFQGAVTEGCP